VAGLLSEHAQNQEAQLSIIEQTAAVMASVAGPVMTVTMMMRVVFAMMRIIDPTGAIKRAWPASVLVLHTMRYKSRYI
jgi:hypothetical protein